MTIIHRTNPDRKLLQEGEVFACAACGNPWPTEAEARTCAEKDHAARANPAEVPAIICKRCKAKVPAHTATQVGWISPGHKPKAEPICPSCNNDLRGFMHGWPNHERP